MDLVDSNFAGDFLEKDLQISPLIRPSANRSSRRIEIRRLTHF